MSRFFLHISLVFLLALASISSVAARTDSPIVIGSKTFTESVLLGEIVLQLAETGSQDVSHKRQLGGTRVLWNGLLAGEIDAYPEYTGTLIQEILADFEIRDDTQLRAILAQHGVHMTAPLGFNNTYAMGVKRALAGQLKLRTISDLVKFPELKLGFSSEFIDRADGWPGLQRHYGLPQQNVRGLDHDLAYRALDSGSLDVIDLYMTDAEIKYYDLFTLEDDTNFFPVYNAVILYRDDLRERAPQLVSLIGKLAGRISAPTMIGMNARAKLDHEAESIIAAEFVEKNFNIVSNQTRESPWQRFWRNTKDHLVLVTVSLTAAIFVALPLGIWSARKPKTGQIILGVAAVIQTIPSLALFVFMIPLLGIGGPPAVAALFLYSLLPIIRNTYAGLTDIDSTIHDSAVALGLSSTARLRLIELPLSARAILAGIKTSAVINVGTATLAALIGAGGYGQPILTGIRLDDMSLILQGAVPAALLALMVQGMFELAEHWVVPRGLRLGTRSR